MGIYTPNLRLYKPDIAETGWRTEVLLNKNLDIIDSLIVVPDAKGDGVTDDRDAIQSAIDDVYALGGGTIYLSKGVYLLNSFSSSYNTLISKSGVSIVGCGPSSIIKVADGLRSETQGVAVLYDHNNPLADILYSNFTVDFNGQNNLDLWHNSTSSVNRMGGAAGIRNVRFDRMNFKNAAGAHFIYLSNGVAPGNVTELASVTNCYFESCGKAITGNLTTDHSSIYFDVNSGIVANNILIQPNANDSIASAIETHGSDVVVEGNSIYGYGHAVNIGADVRDATNILISNNSARDVNSFVVLYTAEDYTLSDVKINGNIAKLKETTGLNSICVYALYPTMVSSENGSFLSIQNNHFVGPENPTLTGYSHVGIYLNRFDDVRIQGNFIKGFVQEGIEIEAEENRKLKRYDISNNQIMQCGFTTNEEHKRAVGFISGTDLDVNDIDFITINNNQIYCDSSVGTAAQYGIYLGGYTDSRYPHVEIKDNVISGYSAYPIGEVLPSVVDTDILIVRGEGPMDPFGNIPASIGSTWLDTTSGKTYNALVPWSSSDKAYVRWVTEIIVTASPTSLAGRAGDRAVLWPPVEGQPKAWNCTVTGDPGTWVSEGNL